MKIIKLIAENIKRLKAIEVTPDGNVVKISGRNRQGKTSLLDAILWAFKGRTIQEEPVREGEDQARVFVDLGKYLVERVFKNGKSTLTVSSTDGAKYSSPQNLLDSMVGDLSFDPLGFAREKPAKQYAQLAEIAGLGEDLAKFEGREKTAFDERADANREVKRLAGVVAGYEGLPEVTPEQVDPAELWTKINEAERHNMALANAAADKRQRLNDLQRHERELAAGKDRYEEAAKALEALGQPIDTTDLERERGQAQENASILGKCQQRDRDQAALDAAEKEANRLDKAVDRNRAARVKMLNDATFPVEGLSLDGGTVTLNGHPFDQASSAERLRVSMAIAMHANPEVRIIRVTDASLLDSESMAVIEEMAAADDFQIWLEIVDESKKVGVVIEDGEVIRVNKSKRKAS